MSLRRDAVRACFRILFAGCVMVAAYKFQNTVSLLRIAASYRAKMYCACRLISKQSHEFCDDWTYNPLVARKLVPVGFRNQETQKTESGAYIWKKTAHYDAATDSCRLD